MKTTEEKALEIAKEDSNFLQLVQNQIKDECQKNGVEEKCLL